MTGGGVVLLAVLEMLESWAKHSLICSAVISLRTLKTWLSLIVKKKNPNQV